MNDRSRLQTTFMGVATTSHSQTSIYLVNGIWLRGVIAAEDAFCLLLIEHGRAQLVYKHAISTIMPEQPVSLRDDVEPANPTPPS
jgi:host factor-I protein